jgi:UDP-glucose 4-epimerase
MNILVTGGSGFIGSHTVDLLVQEGFTTIVADINKCEQPNPDAIYYYADFTQEGVLEEIFARHEPEAVFHLAAQVSVELSMINPIQDVQVNVLGTLKLLEQCRKYKAKIIFASSAAVYGLPESLPISETHPHNPISIYGLSKLTVEKYIQLYHEQFGIEYCILRYSNVYGPRQGNIGEGGVISIFLEKLMKNQIPYIFGNGEQTRDFIYVGDVARANLQALKQGKNHVFNVATLTETSINQIIEILVKKLNSTVRPKIQPPKKGDITRSILDSTNMKNTINWSPNVDITTGLALTIDYFIETRDNKS